MPPTSMPATRLMLAREPRPFSTHVISIRTIAELSRRVGLNGNFVIPGFIPGIQVSSTRNEQEVVERWTTTGGQAVERQPLGISE